MSELTDQVDISCRNCPLQAPGMAGFMRTMSREMMSGDIEDAEQAHIFEAMSDQAGDAILEFWDELDESADFITVVTEAQKRFGPLMTAAIDQAEATFEADRKKLSEVLLEGQPGRIICSGPITVNEKTFCGGALIKATSEDGLKKQATLQHINEDFVERAVNSQSS